MSVYDKASLVLIPSGTKTSKVYSQKPVNGDGDFTFSRSTAATRVNADGNIEKGRENVLRYSNQPNTHAINLSTYSGSQPDPFGGNTAWAWRETATTGQHYGITNNNQVLGVGVWTFSVYVKPVNKTSVYFTWNSPNASNYGNVDFNFTSKTFTKSNVIEAGYEELSNGWFRLYYAINVSVAGAHNVYYNTLSTYAGNTSNGYDFTRFQIERGLVATDYIETDAGPVEAGITDNVPRLDYTDSSCPALLLEPQRTNAIENSEYTADLILVNVARTQNSLTSPEGVDNATTIASNTTAGPHYFGYNQISVTSGTYYSASLFVKKGTGRYFQLLFGSSGFGTTEYANFDLQDGVITYEAANADAKIVDYGNGWYRCSIVSAASANTTETYYGAIINSATAGRVFGHTDSLDYYIYGAQYEAASYATSYIPTYGTSVTRNVDSCSKTGISSLIGQTEGTIYAELNWKGETGGTDLAIWMRTGLTPYNEMIALYIDNSYKAQASVRSSSTQQVLLASDILSDGIIKMAFAYSANDFAFYVNGVLVGTDTSGSIPTCDQVYLGGYPDGGARRGKNKQTLLFKTRLSNEELAALTTI